MSQSIQQPFSQPKQFVPATAPHTKTDGEMDGETGIKTDSITDSSARTWWFICTGSTILTTAEATDAEGNASCSLPQHETLADLSIAPIRTQFLGYLNGQPCVGVEVDKATEPAEGLVFQNLRSLYGVLSEDLFAIAARAVQIMEWNRTHQYCGHCATPTTQLSTERAKCCPNCNLRQYPKLSPAVIMLIYKGDQLLLARAPRFRNGMYSVLAGFVEPGESLEETVARETREEVGIEIKNIRYFGSQPWPFPNSLMVGFTAEYASGDITPDPGEIEAADWFWPSELPPVPGKLSIARKLIDWFVRQDKVAT